MLIILRNANKVIILTAVILAYFYYRTCVRVMQTVESDHVNLLLHLTMISFLFFGLCSTKGKKIRQSEFCKLSLLLMIVIVFGNILNWQGASSFIGPLLWCIYFLVAYLFAGRKEDEVVLNISSVVVCVITLITGYLSMRVASILNQSVNVGEEYEEFLNIIGFTVTTLPAVMLLKIPPIKWLLYFVTAIIAIVTGRRLALTIVGVIAVLSLFEARSNKRNKLFIMIATALFLLFAYNFIASNMSESLDMALFRISFDDVISSEGSGRFDIWDDVMNALASNNLIEWLIGHGSYGVLTFAKHTAAHNEFLEFLFDYGIIGLGLLLSVHVVLIKRVLKLFEVKSEYRYSYFMSYLVFLLYGMFGNVLIYPEYCLPLVTYWGYMEAKFVRDNRNSRLNDMNPKIGKNKYKAMILNTSDLNN